MFICDLLLQAPLSDIVYYSQLKKQTNKIEKNKRERKRERDAHTHHYSSGEKNATSYAFLSQITGAIPLSVLQVVFHSDHAVYHILKGDILLCSFLTSLFYCWTLLE